MNNLTLLACAAAVAAGAAALTTSLRAEGATPTPASAPDAAVLQRLATLEQRIDRLQSTVDAATASAAATRTSAVPTDAAARAAAADAPATQAPPSPQDAAAQAPPDLDAQLQRLRGRSDFWSNSELYRQIHAQGGMAALLDELEALADEAPNDAEAQMDYANACLAWLQLDQSKWSLSMKADAAFDKALAADPSHWSARFTKAMSYTFWPDFLGKKKDAIAHFERLADQQDLMPAQAHQAQTYLYLGNLLEERGEKERARAAWERGLRRHPGDQGLRQKLDG